jgi:hypothetical protein
MYFVYIATLDIRSRLRPDNIMADSLIRDSAGSLIPVRKILKITGIRPPNDGKYEFDIVLSSYVGTVSCKSEVAAIRRLYAIRRSIYETSLGRSLYDGKHDIWASWCGDPNDFRKGFTIPIWAVECVKAPEKNDTPRFMLQLASMRDAPHPSHQFVSFYYGHEGYKWKTRKEALAAMNVYRASLLRDLERVGFTV